MNSYFRIRIKGKACLKNVISSIQTLSSDERNSLLKLNQYRPVPQARTMGNLFSSKVETAMQSHQYSIEQRMVVIQRHIQQTNNILDIIGIGILLLLILKIMKHGLALIHKCNKELEKSYEKKYGNRSSDQSPV